VEVAGGKQNRTISSTWQLIVDKAKFLALKIVTLSIRLPDLGTDKSLYGVKSAATTDGHKLFRNFFTHLVVSQDSKTKSTTVKFELGEREVWE
jgi:hypothetical protein